ncbi:MAG: hypothetical protein COA99_05375 [Moraxellaceae bacterium]|nr:MAG: hypothetical protein COA99_05375 [Moraxellaceae bacterium]
MKHISVTKCFIIMLFLTILTSPARAGFIDINLTFEDNSLTDSQEFVFSLAGAVFESVLKGTQSVEDMILNIPISSGFIDGPPVVGESRRLATATTFCCNFFGGFAYTAGGSIEVDSADIDRLENNDSLIWVAIHEIAHVLGFNGPIWEMNGAYVADSGMYTGAAGLAAYRSEFDPAALFVPVDASNGHWDESWAGGPDEIMTALLGNNINSLFISNTTYRTFEDIGFIVRITEPTTILLFLSAFITMAWKRRSPLEDTHSKKIID